MTEAERPAFGAEQPWGVTPANAFAGITMRNSDDHRIPIRQGLSDCPGQRIGANGQAQVQARHKALFDARFPMLKVVGMAHTWSGFVCLSRNGAPAFGALAPDIWSAVCQNAVGVTKGTFGGILADDLPRRGDSPLFAEMESLGAPGIPPPACP